MYMVTFNVSWHRILKLYLFQDLGPPQKPKIQASGRGCDLGFRGVQ